ncbi:antibiotic biosynthesis monooxygenase [Oxyplasma meridianum]|uniref:Antibiotic biosynthesis monooxygenase n=1 Tax=Oxyplasma meridianum TaxID=3073602 RepID=A0AAX4NJF2_9ARCH
MNESKVRNVGKGKLEYHKKMANIGFYYTIKEGHEKEFENTFQDTVEFLKLNAEGYKEAHLYREVGKNSYMILSLWDSVESFSNFVKSREFGEVTKFGKLIVEGKPYHKIFMDY